MKTTYLRNISVLSDGTKLQTLVLTSFQSAARVMLFHIQDKVCVLFLTCIFKSSIQLNLLFYLLKYSEHYNVTAI